MILEFPTFWCWVILPLLAYIIERTIRIIRGSKKTAVHLAIMHPSNVIELQLEKKKFKYAAGRYAFLNSPYIARHEWHPFTISSSPDEPYISFHIRVVGDWTGKLKKLLNPNDALGIVQKDMLTAPDGSTIIRIDGPFGTSASDIFKFKTVMLVSAGIGVTPYASILKSIKYKIESMQDGAEEPPVGKVYFYWVNRNQEAFEWFLELLATLENNNINNFLEICIYLTSAKSKDDVKDLEEDEEEGSSGMSGRDPITGLKSGTNYGRPNFGSIFDQVAAKHPNESVGVFFCGPRVISKTLYKCSRQRTKSTSTKFKYHKENF
eukprot:TRINITY_DN574_c0_g4_i1.p1 TRINITY_DN574_c0_g4~~TRINITY_DN574_c0_g4_i1.p1  ORF type:complete len:321 (+),score=54.54 TRINITY_DN574_c0_g4_i1:137-1099(+)